MPSEYQTPKEVQNDFATEVNLLEQFNEDFLRDNPPKKRMHISGIIEIVVLCILIILTGCSCFSTSIFGMHFFRVISESMLPTLDVNNTIAVINATAKDIKIGDIVTYVSPEYDEPITHRVVEKFQDENGSVALRVKGDNNFTEDPIEVKDGMIVGKTVAVFKCSPDVVKACLIVIKIIIMLVMIGLLYITLKRLDIVNFRRKKN